VEVSGEGAAEGGFDVDELRPIQSGGLRQNVSGSAAMRVAVGSSPVEDASRSGHATRSAGEFLLVIDYPFIAIGQLKRKVINDIFVDGGPNSGIFA